MKAAMSALESIQPLSPPMMTRSEELALRLEQFVTTSGVEPGTLLGTKEEIREKFGVSNGTLNEALRVCETRGILSLKRGWHGGVFVAHQSARVRLSQVVLGLKRSAETVEQCLATRNQLEPLVVEEAARGRDAAGCAELRDLLGHMERTADDPTESLKWNWRLHRRIAQCGTNRVLASLYLTLMDFLEAEVVEVAPSRSYVAYDKVIQLHRDIVEAIIAGDVARAKAAANRHPLPVFDNLGTTIFS
jgi:DNA-binding FadR family transcriptional regulator